MAKNNKPGRKTLIRIIALVMCILLAGTAIYASIISIAYAQTEISAVYDAGNAALAASQSTVFLNDTQTRITRMPFALYLNSLKRNDALPAGPGGVELYGATVNGEKADWSTSLDECKIFVKCDVAPGETAVFGFTYAVMLPESKLFAGTGDVGARLSFFYPATLIHSQGDFFYCDMSNVKTPMFFPEDDYKISVALPYGYIAVAGAKPVITKDGDGTVYAFELDSARDASLSIGRRYVKSESGACTAYANNLKAAKTALDAANYAINLFNERIGGDLDYLEIVQVDLDESSQSHSGVVWLSSDEIVSGDVEKSVVNGVAKQYFTQSVLANPEYESWLNDALCAYLTCLYYRERYSQEAFERVLNDYALDAVNTTIPGGLTVDSDLSLFSVREEYEAIVVSRGVAAINEVRHAMGFDEFWQALNIYYGENAHSTASVSDFATALNRAHGSSVDYLLMESLANISEYLNQSPERLD